MKPPLYRLLLVIFLSGGSLAQATKIFTPINLTGATSAQSSNPFGFAATNGLDGNMGTITHTNTETGPWFKATLSANENFNAVRVWSRAAAFDGGAVSACCPERMQDLTVRVYDDLAEANEVFYSGVLNPVGTPAIPIHVTTDAAAAFSGRVVKVGLAPSNPNYFSLAELQVGNVVDTILPLGTDLTRAGIFNMTTSLNTQYQSFWSGLAVDGNSANFAHANTMNGGATSWQVDFGEDLRLQTITVTNRAGGDAGRFADLTLTILNQAGVVVHTSPVFNPGNTLPYQSNWTLNLTALNGGSPMVGKTVRITRTGDYLTLAEVTVVGGGLTDPGPGSPPSIVEASSTYDQGAPFTIGSSIDSILSGANGWGVGNGQFANQTAYFRIAPAATAAKLLFTMMHNLGGVDHHIQEFRLSVTQDSIPGAGSAWTVLTPTQLASSTTSLAMVGDRIRSTGSAASATFLVTTGTPFPNITGVRLEVFPYDYNTGDALAASLGRAANGNFVLSEFKLAFDPEENVALYRPVTASAAVWPGFPVTNIVDGNPGTFTHAEAATGTLGLTYEVDLGSVYQFSRLVLKNRNDGCCPERLSNYSVRIFTPNASNDGPGDQVWAATIRGDGSNSGNGGLDTILVSADPTGAFAGRYIQVVNLSDGAYNPQIAELEAYGNLAPVVISFTVDDDTISSGQSATLSWNAANFTTLTLNPGNISLISTSGTMQVTPAATTTYTITASNGTVSDTKAQPIGVDVVLLPPVINEFVAENDGQLKDEDDDSSDWIELRNPNPYRLEIGGYYLTDNVAQLTKWQIPAGAMIPANGYRVIFASEKNRVAPNGELHTTYKLANSGEYIGLIASNGTTILQQIPSTYPTPTVYPVQKSNVSYGYSPDGDVNGVIGYMQPPTPGKANGAAYEGIVNEPVASVVRGFYDTVQSVSLTTTTPGATIRYTINGSLPTASTGTEFMTGNPISISTNTILRAAAFRSGWGDSNVITHTYIFPSSVISSTPWVDGALVTSTGAAAMEASLKDLPTVSIVTPNTISDGNRVAASVEWIRPDGIPGFQENCGVELFGGAFTNFAKKSFRLAFSGSFGATSVSYPLFDGYAKGRAAVDTFDALELRSGSHDMAMRGFYMSNTFTDDTMLEMGNFNPHGRYVHLYMNGVYHGMYHLRERWGADMSRRYLGGEKAQYEAINGNYNVGGWADPGTPYDGTGAAWSQIKALGGDYNSVRPYLNVTQYVDYMVMWMFGHSEDEYRCVGPNVAGSGFQFFLNDADGYLALDTNSWNGQSNHTGFTAPGAGRLAGDGPGSLLSKLYNSANSVTPAIAAGGLEFRMLLADRIYKACFNNGALTPVRNQARLNLRCTEVQNAFISEAARWNQRSVPSWVSYRDTILNTWFPARTDTYIGQLRGSGYYPAVDAPMLNQQGGTVASGFQPSFTGPGGAVVYFTLDGTDPRLVGGGVHPSAQAFTVGSSAPPAGITKHTVVKARVKSGANWSALNEAFFQVGASPVSPDDVVISEIHFNPSDLDTTEFVELWNVSDKPVNLRGAGFTEGIEFTFSEFNDAILNPGERLVLVADQYNFQVAYGIEIPIAGIFRGSLNNGGETITFRSASAELLDSFTYDGAKPWPTGADGGGFSLTLAHPQLPHSDASAWRTSFPLGGTPGTTDATAFTGSASADADQDGLEALVEYALGTSDNNGTQGPSSLVGGMDLNGNLTLTAPLNPQADDVLVDAEYSTDLVEWFPANRTTYATQANGSVQATWTAPANGESRVFIRLVVTRP